MVPVWIVAVFLAPALGTPLQHALVLIPSKIQVGIQEKICLLQPMGEGSASLRVTLQHAPSNTSVNKETAGLVGNYGCVEFTVPDIELNDKTNSVANVTVISRGLSKAINITKKVLLKKTQPLTFVQTDKPVYKPGQTVRFRVFSLTQDFMLANVQYQLITIWDPQQNRIGQWRNVTHKQGIVDLTYNLHREPPMGTYEIEVITSQGKKKHLFVVEEYVLPKFEVKLQFPNSITIIDKSINVRMCGRYTYGKPVRGVVNGTVCLMAHPQICHYVAGKTDTDGCFSRDLTTSLFKVMTNWRNKILAHFVLEENGTGIREEKSATCSFASEVTKIHFEDIVMYYKKGLPLSGKVVITLGTGEPMPGVEINLFNTINPGAQQILVNDQGEGTFCLDTSEWVDDEVSFMAIYQLQPKVNNHPPRLPGHTAAWHTVKRFYSKSNSFLSIISRQRELPCTSELEIPINYILKVLPEKGSLDLEVFQLVMARGWIVSFEKSSHSIEGTEEGEFLLHQRITPDMSPIARILVFTVLPNEEVIADTVKFNVEKCFHNQVQLQFSGSEELPGTRIKVDLRAKPGSLCGLRVVDKSVLLLKPRKQLTIDSIYSSLPIADLNKYHHLVKENDESFCKTNASLFWVNRTERRSDFDVSQLLEGMGLKIFTDLDYHVPVNCQAQHDVQNVNSFENREISRMLHFSRALSVPFDPMLIASQTSETGTHLPEEKVREYFPETWIWDLAPVSSSGQASLDVTVPDTITEWKGSAFCSGDAGFGLSLTESLIAFKPFFVDLVLPYSLVRTEVFSLKAMVFNYLADNLMVKITLEEAEGFDFASSERERKLCVLSKDAVTVSWNLTASGLGEKNVTVRAESVASSTLCGNEVVVVPPRGAIDIIRKPLIIEPEGIETQLSHSFLLCPAGKNLTENIQVRVPEDVVEGSARAYVTVLGRSMGKAMKNLDELLTLPTGCGEQSLAKFAPNIYVLNYLQLTHQLTPQIKEKALDFLRKGYQCQMNYKNSDGSYNFFRGQDEEGNTWLTAFVLKCFLQAQLYIFIDDSVLQQAASFLLKSRLESGCFRNVGKQLNNALKGGINDSISHSAYVTTALLELQRLRPDMADKIYNETQELSSFNNTSNKTERTTLPETETVKTQPRDFMTTVLAPSLRCLRKQMERVNSTYSLALLAYTFTLAGDNTSRDSLLKKLEGLAIKKDGMRHWSRNPQAEKVYMEPWRRAPSAEVEITAYVLLALLSQSRVSPADLEYATSIVNWLVQQRNAYGGFTSTQDTVVALHALSIYDSLTHVSDAQALVILTGKNKFHREFRLNASNQLTLQTETLPEIPGDYVAHVSGKNCVLLQTTLRFNTVPKHRESAFRLSAAMKRFRDDPSAGTININATYVGSRSVSNMVIMDVKIPSGYSAQVHNAIHPRIRRSERAGGHFVMYIPEMNSFVPVQVSVPIHRDFLVTNIQDGYVTVYDYYETDESAIIGYH